ncbi:MAG: hypothetical protein WBD31_29680 [Rubripirellula sp.]
MKCFSVREVTRVHSLLCLAMLGVFVGCDQQDSAPKTSHFEHDHDVAPHWPSDLADAASKIRERLVWTETGEVTEHHQHDEHQHDEHDDHHHDHDPNAELVDLVSWIPEVAADTNLSEADWLPLYDASHSLMAKLRGATGRLSSDTRSQIESLCELIDDAVPKIPEQLPSLKVTSS